MGDVSLEQSVIVDQEGNQISEMLTTVKDEDLDSYQIPQDLNHFQK